MKKHQPSKKQITIRYAKKAFIILLIFALLASCFTSFASAAKQNNEKGFVEYKTNASINFNEIIEVVLTNKATNDQYTHSLYRINNYEGNFPVELGSYSVSARVVLESGTETSQYFVSLSEDNISVQNTSVAVPLTLTVNFSSEDLAAPTEDETGNTADTFVEYDENGEIINSDSTEEEKDDFWVSTAVFAGIFFAFIVGYFIIRRKLLN